MFFMKNAIYLAGSLCVLVICFVVKGSEYLALISSYDKHSFENNKKNIMAHSYFQQGLVWKANRT